LFAHTPPVGKPSLTVPVDREIGRSSRCRERDCDHFFAPIELEIRMMRCLEYVDLGEAVERRNAKSALGIAKRASAKNPAQFTFKRLSVILVICQRSSFAPKSLEPFQGRLRRWKNFFAVIRIDLENVGGRQPDRKPEGDYSPVDVPAIRSK